MEEAIKWKSYYPIEKVYEVLLQSRSVKIKFEDKNGIQSLELLGPEVVPFGHEFLSECYEIKIIDRNRTEGNFLDFGRWKIEIWDEDNPYSEFLCDEYELTK